MKIIEGWPLSQYQISDGQIVDVEYAENDDEIVVRICEKNFKYL